MFVSIIVIASSSIINIVMIFILLILIVITIMIIIVIHIINVVIIIVIIVFVISVCALCLLILIIRQMRHLSIVLTQLCEYYIRLHVQGDLLGIIYHQNISHSELKSLSVLISVKHKALLLNLVSYELVLGLY